MPGWYVHLEAARVVADRLSRGDIPPGLAFRPGDAQKYGNLGRKWRNFLAIGALGPDLFYLLPDFEPPNANVLLTVTKWILDEWEQVDELFVGPWEDWMGPIGANDADLTAQLTGGLSNQLAQSLDEISSTMLNVHVSLLSRLKDWFGILTSGVPKGYDDSGFYWSDMFHYRRTYDFAQALWRIAQEHQQAADRLEAGLAAGGRVPTADEQAQIGNARAAAESELAFALGWMTHCATDVTGHPFTNAKCGGPYRLHWQRHHLVENHMDAATYDQNHHGDALYGELGTSALHFRIAFRTREDAPYDGCHFAPAYDYFSGFPAYPLGKTASDDEKRSRFFDMDPGKLPEHLVTLIDAAMADVYGDDPKVLMEAPAFSDGGSGRPNADALNVMWEIAFRYLRHVSSDGLHPSRPEPPPIVSEHPFPTPPRGALPAEDDGRGGDPSEDTSPSGKPFNVFDVAIGVLAWIRYIAQVVEWLITVVPSLVLDPLTFPAREFIYYTILAPLYSLYMASRKLLVLEGFLLPKPEEIEPGLTTLGVQPGSMRLSLADDLRDPTGFSLRMVDFDEPSGRADAHQSREVDGAFPRQLMKDSYPVLNQILSGIGLAIQRGDPEPSHWVMPWRYPDRNLAGERIGWESHLTHAGPWVQGTSAPDLFAQADTNLDAARQFEQATTPGETAEACEALFPHDRHLGHPVDYSLYLIWKLTAGAAVPSFNLDADRGYGYHCWDWDRHRTRPTVPPHTVEDFVVHDPLKTGNDRFDFEQPCTVPEQPMYDPKLGANDSTSERRMVNAYRPDVPLQIHYLDAGLGYAPCLNLAAAVNIPPVDRGECMQAGMNPDGSAV